MFKSIPALFLLLLIAATGQAQTVFRIDSLPVKSIILNKGWTWHAGDNPDWAKPELDDSRWEAIDPSQDIYDVVPLKKAELGWFRLRLTINPSVRQQPLALLIGQLGASEIYLNGRLIYRFGVVSAEYEQEQTHFLDNQPVQFQVDSQSEQVLAVRYSFHHQNVYFKLSRINPCLRLTIQQGNKAVETFTTTKRTTTGRLWLLLGWYLILGVMFLLLYNFLKDSKAYLYIGIYMFCYVAYFAIQELVSYMTDTSLRSTTFLIGFTLAVSGTVFYIQGVYLLFGRKRGRLGRVVIGYAILAVPIMLWWYQWGGIMAMLYFLLVITEGLLIAVYGVRRRRPGAWVFVIQSILGYGVYGGAILFATFDQPAYAQLMTAITNLIIPVCSSIFLIGEFGRTAHNLRQRVVEVEQLSAEKEQILTTQNETLERQVSERTVELSEKNQELIIETALERVRTQTMAMQHSDDLQQVITVVSEQLQALGFQFDLVNFVVFNADITEGWYAYNAVPYQSAVTHFHIPYLDHTLFYQTSEIIRQGLGFYTYSLTHEEKNTFYRHCFEHTVLKDLPEERKQHLYNAQGMTASVVILLSGEISLSIINYRSIPYKKAENAIFKRFGAVFGQAYTRFLDLQKAEVQAREAKIEAALERVRSRSLAMHASEELKEVITLVFAQLNQLDIAITDGAAVIVLFSEDSKDVIHWTANPDRISEATRFRLPYIDHPFHNVYWDAREKELDFVANFSTLEEKNSFWDQAFVISDYKYLSEETKQWIYAAPGYAYSLAIGKHSAMFMDSHKGKMYSEQENDILKRFARVFEQAYTRFLDLQKAETQAREAQIEAALERVRSESMAMRHSDQLQAVITVVSEQLQALGFLFDYVNFVVVRADRGWDSYSAGPTNSEIVNFTIPYVDHKLFSQGEEALQQGVDFFVYNLTPDEKAEWLSYLFSQTILKEAPAEYKQSVIDLPGMAGSVVCSLDLGFSIVNYQGIPYTDTENSIFKRFGAVFGQAYTRFKDLKKAEEQARQAIRTASLDRVRAQIASMRTAQDLERITPLIWAELTTLQVPFFRCGVFIVDEAQHRIQAFLSTPDGRSRTQLNLPIDQTQNNRQLVESWRQQQVYSERWSHEQLQEWASSMVDEGQIDSVQEYEVVEEVKEAFSLQFIPFRQGMLYVGSQEPLSQPELDVTQSLADAFSVAYARYEDFRQLEEAKVRVDATLTELKVTQTQLIQKEKLASLGELTAGIAHEIQNPLNFVNNFSEVSAELVSELKDELGRGDTQEVNAIADDLAQNLQKIVHHGKRASSIVRGMLAHSRTSTGERRSTDLNAMTDEYLRLAYHGIRAKHKDVNYELITAFDPHLESVEVMPQEIGRVLLNLFNNAFYAIHQRASALVTGEPYIPTVWVSTHRQDNAVEIRIKDNGTGISESVKAKIFQPFFTTKPTGEGTGLGLSLSYDIVTKGHGGTMTMESREGQGSEFIVRLPM